MRECGVNDVTLEEFTMVMSYLVSAYPGANISGPTTKVYFEHLKDIPFETMEKAAAKIVEGSRFFPTVAELREMCLKEERPEFTRNTFEALALINDAISKFGRYRPAEALEYIRGQDMVLYNIVKAIRFNNICSSDLRKYRTELEMLYKESSEDMRKSAQLTGTTVSQIMRLSKKMEYEALTMEKEEILF